MTPAEITAYVMALPVEELRRLSATDVMGWVYEADLHGDGWYVDRSSHFSIRVSLWRPDEDRNQSRMVTDRVIEVHGEEVRRHFDAVEGIRLMFWWKRTPDQETRAALIAHMIHKQEVGE